MAVSNKHSLTIRGHRTSVSLEPEFWQEFRNIATESGLSANELASRIDAGRDAGHNLASSIRVFVLNHVLHQGACPTTASQGRNSSSQ